jgi:hypothetical protein
MKWVHSLKGRTLVQAIADVLDMPEESYWTNKGVLYNWHGCALWGMNSHDKTAERKSVHSWDTIKECLKYGFTIDDEHCVIAKGKDTK